MMKRMLTQLACCLVFVLFGKSLFAQTTVLLPLSKDAFIQSGNATTNFGTHSNLWVYSNDGLTTYRSAIGIDLSSIPDDAIVTSAIVHLFNVNTTNPSIVLERFDESWNETEINYVNQPNVVGGRLIYPTVQGNTDYLFDVTDDVIKMFDGIYDNHGWLLRLENELSSEQKSFHSRNSATVSLRPYVEIIYTSPLRVENVAIVHASDQISLDGSISPDISGGSGNYTFQWVNGSNGAIVGNEASIANLAHGWYGLHVTDTSTSEEKYIAFVLGAKSGEVTIDFKPGPEYVDDAMIYDLVKNGVDYGNNNYGNHTLLRAEKWTNGSWYNLKSCTKFKLWMDDEFEISQADLYLTGSNHYPLSRPNTSEFRMITSPWEEQSVTYKTKPSIGSTPLQILSGTPQGNENKVVDMSSFWNEWKQDNSSNFGVMFQLQSEVNLYTRMRYHSTHATNISQRPWTQFKLSIPVSVAWDDVTELGSVQVDISSLSSTGPYHYMIAKTPIPNLSETYSYLADSVGFPIDSIEFFTGNSTATSHIFTSVEAGLNHIAVFDSQGNRIFEKSVTVFGDFDLDTTSVSITAVKNSIRANVGENGVGSVKLYTIQGDNQGFEVELDAQSSSPQYIGFSNSTSQVSSYSDIIYGVHFDGTSVRTIQNGSLSEPFSVNFSDRTVQFQIINGVLEMKANDQLLVTQSLPAQYSYKLGLGIQDGAQLNVSNLGMLPFPNKFVVPKFKSNVIRHFNCSDQTPMFSFSVVAQSSVSYTYSVSHETGQLVGNGSVSTNQSVAPFTSFSNGDPLLPGSYTVQYTIAGVVYSNQVDLGYEADWAQRDQDYTEDPNAHSLLINGNTTSYYLQARSSNTMRYDEEGWVEFTPILDGAGHSAIRPTTLNLDDLPGLSLANEEFVHFFKQNVFNNFYTISPFSSSQGSLPSFTVFNNARVKLKFTLFGGTNGNGEIKIYADNVYKGSIARGNSSIIARFNSMLDGDGFKDVITSFPCPEPTDMYAQLKYKLDGFYHIMKNGKIRFVFDQEYDTDDLTFNIYNKFDVLVKTQADFPSLTATNGDNYLTIDVSHSGYCIGRGFFYLEVINSKKEKMYLRFFNDYSFGGCQDYINSNESNN